MDTPKLVTVYIAEGKLAGDMARLLLESFGLNPSIAQESVGSTYGLTMGPVGQVDVMVPESQVEEAQEIIEAWEQGEFDEEDDEDTLGDYSNKTDTKF